MTIERKFIVTASEMREIIMSAWVDGWHERENNDDGKRLYCANKINELIGGD